MELDKLFITDKKNSTEKIMNLYAKLNDEVSKYICEERPILLGDIDLYKNIIGEKELPDYPQDVSEVLKQFSILFQRAVIWENPGTMINITPPVNIASLVAAFYTALYNPNFAQDESSGYLMTTELLVSKYMADLVGWDNKKARGIFTFGGKGTNLYAVKIGLKKAFPDIIENGLQGRKAVVISNEKAHPCHLEVCDWIGLGKNSCLRLSTNEKGQVKLEEMEKCLRNQIENDVRIGCIILNGGTTNEVIIDPIRDVVKLRDKLVEEYKLDYIPHIHVDAVIGFAWLFFTKYDFTKNSLNMNNEELKKMKAMTTKISQIKYADSFGADFHKTGFCPYVSSLFMSRNFCDITMLGNKTEKKIDELNFGEYSPFEYTLELTRSSMGPVSAYVALETFGIKGFQELIYNLFSNGEYIRSCLNLLENFEVINIDTEGIATLFVIHNKRRKYLDYINLSSSEVKEFLDYNHQFYLYCLKLLEEKEINFKITFSKSYKPYGSKIKMGALKIYPTSPLTTRKQIDDIINEIKIAKNSFDNCNKELKETRDIPIDYVYRD